MGLPKYSMAVGLNKGYKTTKIAEVSKHRQSRRKGVCQFNLYVISEFWTKKELNFLEHHCNVQHTATCERQRYVQM